jgi:tetratricopeptide (TPR) repeat protein
MSALHQSTVALYRAETYFKRSLEISPDDDTVKSRLAEVHYLLGHYEEAAGIWSGLADTAFGGSSGRRADRLARIKAGTTPRIPPVDYLEAIGVAFDCYQADDFEECAAILEDILDDIVFCEDFPLPEVWYYLGQCYQNLAMPRKAADCFGEALKLEPGYPEAKDALAGLSP